MKSLIKSIALAGLVLCGCTQNRDLLLVGTFTDTDSEGIYSYAFNQDNGKWELLAVTPADNPAFINKAGAEEVLCVSENGTEKDGVGLYKVDRASGKLEMEKFANTATIGPCYVSTNGKLVLTANYSGGSLDVFSSSLELMNSIPAATGGPHPNQAEGHMHCAYFTTDGEYILITDFSADRIHSLKIEDEGLIDYSEADVKPGSGPRHITFSPNNKFAYVIGELSGEITAFEYAHGTLTQIQTAVADSLGGQGSADIHLSPDGKFLYSSNRLKGDGIAIFSVDAQTGLLSKAGYCPTQTHPRNFCISPNGKWLLCACRDGNSVQIFRRDPRSGLLKDTRNDIPVSHPVCVMFP